MSIEFIVGLLVGIHIGYIEAALIVWWLHKKKEMMHK